MDRVNNITLNSEQERQMKKEKKILIIALVAIVVLILAQKKRVLDSMDFRPGFPRNFKFDFPSTLTFEMPFTVFNGANGTLKIGAVDLKIFAEGQYVGRAFSGVSQTINPLGQSVLYTQVIMYLSDMAFAIPNFVNGLKDQVVNFTFDGVLNVEGFYKSVSIPVSFNLPKFK